MTITHDKPLLKIHSGFLPVEVITVVLCLFPSGEDSNKLLVFFVVTGRSNAFLPKIFICSTQVKVELFFVYIYLDIDIGY